MSSLTSKVAITDISLSGKRVLVRVDFNCPIKNGVVTDPRRVMAVAPTIRYILQQNPKSIVLMSHRGRPKGQRNMKFTLKPVVPIVEEAIGRKVNFLDDCCGPKVEEECRDPPTGTVILLENLRFCIAEEGKGVINNKKRKATKAEIKQFRASLAKLGDVYINDAFGTAHRAHSSMVGVDLPIKASGFLLGKELAAFSNVVTANPPRPFLAILGGAKVADKLPLIMNLLDKVDEIIISGAMAYTFLKIRNNMPIGNSLFDEAGAKLVPKILEKAKQRGINIHLPTDFKLGRKFSADTEVSYSTLEKGIPDGWMGLDTGAKTQLTDAQVIWRAKSIVMNGPIGAFELPPFETGTLLCLHALAAATHFGAVTIIGGGDSAAAALKYKLDTAVTHVSTGGGASLELLEGKILPGIAALSDKKVHSKL